MFMMRGLLVLCMTCAGWAASCSPQRAFQEHVLRTPEPVRFGCAVALEQNEPITQGSLVLGHVRDLTKLLKCGEATAAAAHAEPRAVAEAANVSQMTPAATTSRCRSAARRNSKPAPPKGNASSAIQ
jgi:hypothetical protein